VTAATHALLSLTQCKKVSFHGLEKTLEGVKTLLKPPVFAVPLAIDYVPLSDGPLEIEGATIAHFSLVHRGPCVGYRVESPSCSFAYVTDTTSNGDSVYAADLAGVRVLAHEMYCSIAQDKDAVAFGHTSVLGLKAIVEKCGAKKVVAIHHNPHGNQGEMELEAKGAIPGLIFAADALEISLVQD
jgi:ribonuclease BN (tRNA processing enzyme)